MGLTIWLDGYTEGWQPHEIESIAEGFEVMRTYCHNGGFRFTREVNYEMRELPEKGSSTNE